MQYDCNYFKVQLDNINTEPHFNSYGEEVIWEASFIINCFGIYYSFKVLAYKDEEDEWTDGYLDLHGHWIEDWQLPYNVFVSPELLKEFVNKATWYLNSNEWFTLLIAWMLKGRH